MCVTAHDNGGHRSTRSGRCAETATEALVLRFSLRACGDHWKQSTVFDLVILSFRRHLCAGEIDKDQLFRQNPLQIARDLCLGDILITLQHAHDGLHRNL